MGDEARWLYMRWARREEWACVYCDDEPWGLGVWPDRDSPADFDGYGDITPAAAAWVKSATGVEWLAIVRCEHCGSRHLDPADCTYPPDG